MAKHAQKPRLLFEGGEFRILQITDMHLGGFAGREATSMALLSELCGGVKPGLVAFTGDIVGSGPAAARRMERLNSVLEEHSIPYLFVFGNHEGGGKATALSAALSGFPLCLFSPGPESLPGTGNFALPVLGGDGAGAFLIYGLSCSERAPLFDSGGKKLKSEPSVTAAHAKWLVASHKRHSAAAGRALPFLIFCHVPLPEYNDMWMFDGVWGERSDKVSASHFNTGFFARIHGTGMARGYFCGHDHPNSFYGRHFGVMLGYGRHSGYHCNCGDNFRRGGRVIVLSEETGDISGTFVALHDGSVLPETFSPPVFNRREFFVP